MFSGRCRRCPVVSRRFHKFANGTLSRRSSGCSYDLPVAQQNSHRGPAPSTPDGPRDETNGAAGSYAKFSGEIVVASKIVDYLSSGLYRTPAACLKELVNNAYDANATTVNVFIKPDADRIVIEDDGEGLSRDEFVRHFSRVSESHKREHDDHTPSGRPKIGKIGIGFVAANEICDEIELVSTQRGSADLLRVTINFAEMRRDAAERRRDHLGEGSIAKGDYEGVVEQTNADDHYTWLFLSQIRGDANKHLMASARRAHSDETGLTLYGQLPEQAAAVLGRLDSWSQLDAYSDTVVNVGLNVPVNYLPDWHPPEWSEILGPFQREVRALGFTVRIDGAELRKPILFREPERSLCETFDFVGQAVAARGYFYAQRRTLKPQDLQGLLLRIRNAAVGEYDRGFWEFPPEDGPLFQSWISAEVWADDRLEEAMNIDRRTLRAGHPAYVELQSFIHSTLHEFIKSVRRELYSIPAAQRRDRAVVEEHARLSTALKSSAALKPETIRSISAAWRPKGDDGSRAKLARRYSISQLYAAVVAAANEVLTPPQARKFLDALTRRLQK